VSQIFGNVFLYVEKNLLLKPALSHGLRLVCETYSLTHASTPDGLGIRCENITQLKVLIKPMFTKPVSRVYVVTQRKSNQSIGFVLA
jgi:hypothetical protein